MNHLFLVVVSVNLSLVSRIKREDVDTFVVDGDELLLAHQVETGDLRFPELEALMAEQHLLFVCRDINDLDVKSVHVNGLEAYDEFLEFLSLVTDDIHVGVGNVELVFPFENKLELRRSVLAESQQEDTKLS